MTMTGPPAFHLLAKPTGPICNLDCEYCFFLSKEMLYPGDRFRMADELLETYIRQLFEAHRTPEVTVAWQGGEPTMMGLDFFKRSVELVEQYRRPWQRADYTIQTNGVLIDDRVGGVLQGAQLPRRAVGRRTQGHPRHLPRRQAQGRFVRPGDGRLRPSAAHRR